LIILLIVSVGEIKITKNTAIDKGFAHYIVDNRGNSSFEWFERVATQAEKLGDLK